MGEVEKPFSCPEQNCDMTFTNEDHLQVHRRCHEIHLTVNSYEGIQSSLSKHTGTGFIIDQTPTPTRFLKHCEEVSLYQDINLNPFDLEFRKASQYRTQLSVIENHGANGGSLETPRILPPVDSDETISSTSHDEVNGQQSSISLFPSLQSSSTAGNVNVTSTYLNSPRITELTSEPYEKKEGRKKLTLNVSTVSESKEISNVISTPTPVITAGPSVVQSLGAVNSSASTLNTPTFLTGNIPQITLNGIELVANDINTPSLSPAIPLSSTPTSVVQHSNYFEHVAEEHKQNTPLFPVRTRPATPPTTSSCIMASAAVVNNTACSVLNSPSATVLQLVLRLPNGQSIPVEIPATPVVPSVTSAVATPLVTSIAPARQSAYTGVISNPGSSSLAKIKLKEALISSNSAARPNVSKHSRATTADRIAEMTRTRNQSGASSNGGDVHDDSNSSCSSGNSNIKGAHRRRNTSSDETPDEKRRRFLERNRAAAVRCREKKKRLAQTIAAKKDELCLLNQKLQNEVSSLRSEVASLKCLLLRHKNCPVTLAMKGEDESVSINGQFPQTFTTFKVQDPSGVITEVTTPVSRTSFSKCERAVPSGPLSETVTSWPEAAVISMSCSNCGLIPSSQPMKWSQKKSSKLRKRSLSTSAISLSTVAAQVSSPSSNMPGSCSNSVSSNSHIVKKI